MGSTCVLRDEMLQLDDVAEKRRMPSAVFSVHGVFV